MSKITVTTIAGLTSGGDANTVKIESGDAFNVVSGATTLGGDLTVDTTTLKVDSSNNRVGMGTASPSRQVMISRSIADGSGELGIVSSDSSTSGALGNIHFGNSTDTSLASIRATADGATDSAKLEFNTEKTGAAIETAMRIDSNGRVTMPYQPMCFVTRISEQTGISSQSSSPTVLVLNTPIFNVGNHYNDVNGRWTAPVAGKYEFSWSYATKTGQAGIYRTFLWKNGSILNYTQLRNDSSGNSSPYNFASRTAILDLAANDYVILQGSIDGSPSVWYSDSQLRTVLTVRLIA